MSEAPAGTVVAVLDEFDKAFGEAAALDEKKPVVEDTSAADAAKAQKEADAAKAAAALTAPPADETAEQKTAREAAEKTAAETAAAAALAVETPEQKTAREAAEAQAVKDTKAAADAKLLTDAAAATLAEDARRRKATDDAAAEAARVAAAVEPPEKKAAREAAEAAMAPYEFTAEEKQFLEKFKTDFPGEYVVMEARMKQMGQSTKAQIHAAVQEAERRVTAAIAPIAAQTQEQAHAAHVTAIYTAHKDFDAVVGKLPEWIKTQPAYLQPVMQAVYDKGDTQSVIALVDDYKKAAGITAPPAASGAKTAEQIAAETAAATAAAAKATQAAADAAGLLPVNSKSTIPAPQGGTSKDDFDGAFAEASDALAAQKK